MIATRVAMDGRREIMGGAVGDNETEVFGRVPPGLRERGLHGARGGDLRPREVMIGSAWQRCRVRLIRNVLANIPKNQTETVAAAICAIFSQPNAELVRKQVYIGADPGRPNPRL